MSAEKKAYLLSSDGHRDSVGLDFVATDEEGIVRVLVYEAETIGQEVIENSVRVDYEAGLIRYNYLDYDGEVEESEWHMITLRIA